MIEAILDNETWGIRTTSIVRSVGVVVFEGRSILSADYFRIDEREQTAPRPVEFEGPPTLMPPRTVDESTVAWWKKPENAKALATIYEAPLITWAEGRTLLGKIGQEVDHVWAKPGMFDLPMLRDLFGQDIWPYWKERDLSTLLGEFDPNRETRPMFKGIQHNALDDAIYAHEWLCAIRDRIASTRQPKTTAGGAIWGCKIGEFSAGGIPEGGDSPMRNAVSEAYTRLTGVAPNFIFSGWGEKLTETERDVISRS